jgi:hypothetical protein
LTVSTGAFVVEELSTELSEVLGAMLMSLPPPPQPTNSPAATKAPNKALNCILIPQRSDMKLRSPTAEKALSAHLITGA